MQKSLRKSFHSLPIRFGAGTLAGLFLLLPFCAQAWSQEEAPPTIHEVKENLETQLKDQEGVTGVTVSDIDGKLRILIHVHTRKARKKFSSLAEKGLEGFTVHVLYVPGSTPNKEEPKKAGKETGLNIPSDRHTNIWGASVLDCDIIQLHLNLNRKKSRKERRLIPCQLLSRKQYGVGGGHAYAYTKHKKSCPIRAGRVAKPAWADAFINWVFEKGFTGISRGGFLWPTEIRASDTLWTKQSELDLLTRLPYIRTGAEWVKSDREKPGFPWEWTHPGSKDEPSIDTPTGEKSSGP